MSLGVLDRDKCSLTRVDVSMHCRTCKELHFPCIHGRCSQMLHVPWDESCDLGHRDPMRPLHFNIVEHPRNWNAYRCDASLP
jgi:hypothetical protein